MRPALLLVLLLRLLAAGLAARAYTDMFVASATLTATATTRVTARLATVANRTTFPSCSTRAASCCCPTLSLVRQRRAALTKQRRREQHSRSAVTMSASTPAASPAYDANCLFCKIIRDEVPAYKVYEDEHALAFLDLFPATAGRTLIIPKSHHATVDAMPAEEFGAMARCLPRIARAVKTATGAAAYNLVQNNGRASGQLVEHVHFHLVPRAAGDGLVGHPKPGGKLEAAAAQPVIDAIKRAL